PLSKQKKPPTIHRIPSAGAMLKLTHKFCYRAQMMIRGRLLATVATVVWLACVMGTEAKGVNAKPPSGPQDTGTLSASNDYNMLLNLTLKNGSPVVHTVDIADIPANRTRLLLAV